LSQLRSVSCVFTIKIGLDWIGDLWSSVAESATTFGYLLMQKHSVQCS